MNDQSYSTLFACIYDQTGSAAAVGGNPPYSVLRSTQARDRDGRGCRRMTLHDFVVVWDDDHDERVIHVLERLHMAGILWPLVFASENRGNLTLLYQGNLDLPPGYEDEVRSICNGDLGDSWNVRLVPFNRPSVFDFNTDVNAVPGAGENAISYLCSIDRQWKLGLREKPLVELRSVWEGVGSDGLLRI